MPDVLRYTPLPTPTSIRLLRRVELDGKKGWNTYELHVFELRDAPAFEAISYTWANPFPLRSHEASYDYSRPRTIWIDGIDVDISQNLDEALSDLTTRKVINWQDPYEQKYRTALHDAAEIGDVRKVDALLRAGAKVSLLDGKGNTPLHLAAINGHVAVVKILTAPEYLGQYLPLSQSHVWREVGNNRHRGENFEELAKHFDKLTVKDLPYEGYWWVDAICINQNDPQERSSQVKLMNQIYSSAHHVSVWLGSSTAELNHGIIAAQDIFFGRSEAMLSRDDVEKLAAIVERRWFSRMWVVQEFVLARDVTFCSTHRLRNNVFEFILSKLAKDPNPFDKHTNDNRRAMLAIRQAERLKKLRNRFQAEEKEPLPLYSLLFECADCECQDARDQIFSLLNLVTNADGEFEPPMDVNYEASVADVYTSATRHILMESRDLSPLSWSSISFSNSQRDSDLPSWVPAYNAFRSVRGPGASLDSRALSATGGFAQRCFKACGSMRADINEQAFEGLLPAFSAQLNLNGIRIDRISKIGETCSGNRIRFKATWLQLTAELVGQYPNGDSHAKALMLTALTGKYNFSSAFKPTTPSRVLDDAKAIWRDLINNSLTCNASDGTGREALTPDAVEELKRLASDDDQGFCSSVDEINAYKAATGEVEHRFRGTLAMKNSGPLGDVLVNALHLRAMFITDDGYLGIGPDGMTKGDEIWLFPGSSVPFLLRKSEGVGEYRHVGETYVHGVMFGERVPKPSEATMESVVLV